MGTRLYVGNLPFNADEDQIRDLFSQGGRTVTEVKLVTDRDTGRPVASVSSRWGAARTPTAPSAPSTARPSAAVRSR
jgi:hypothetical protein